MSVFSRKSGGHLPAVLSTDRAPGSSPKGFGLFTAEAVPVASHGTSWQCLHHQSPCCQGQAGSASQGSLCRFRHKSQRVECSSERTPSGDREMLAICLVSVQPSLIHQDVFHYQAAWPSVPPCTASCPLRRPSRQAGRTTHNKEAGTPDLGSRAHLS